MPGPRSAPRNRLRVMTLTVAGLASAVATGRSRSAATRAEMRAVDMGGDDSHGAVKQALEPGRRISRHGRARALAAVCRTPARAAARLARLSVHGGQRRPSFAVQPL